MSIDHHFHPVLHFERLDVEAIKDSISYSGADVYAAYFPHSQPQSRLANNWIDHTTESELHRRGVLPNFTITNNYADCHQNKQHLNYYDQQYRNYYSGLHSNHYHEQYHGHHHGQYHHTHHKQGHHHRNHTRYFLNNSETIANAKLVSHVARKYGIDPATAVAAMLVESEGKHHAVGDHGKSFGLFQLHQGGLLSTAHLTAKQAFNPYTNASVALKHMRKTMDRHQYNCPGQLVAASQGPAHKHLYAQKVDAMLPVARQILAMT